MRRDLFHGYQYKASTSELTMVEEWKWNEFENIPLKTHIPT